MNDDIAVQTPNTPLVSGDPLLEFGTHVRALLEELLTTSRTEVATQLKQADLVGRLATFGEVEERGGVEAVLGIVAGKIWPRSRVSKRKTVYTYLIEPLGLDYVEEVTTRSESSIKDFEVLYLAARAVKQGNGALSPAEGLAMYAGLSRDEARSLMETPTDGESGGEEELDTWADFTRRLPATLVGQLDAAVTHLIVTHGLTDLQLWTRLAVLLEETEQAEMGMLLAAAENGTSRFVKVLAPNDDGQYATSAGNLAHEVPADLSAALKAPEVRDPETAPPDEWDGSPERDLPPAETEGGEDGEQEASSAKLPPPGTPPKPWPAGIQWEGSRGTNGLFAVRGPRPRRELIGGTRYATFAEAVEALAQHNKGKSAKG